MGSLLYADDIVLIADDESEMQKMLDIAGGYSREFSLNFSIKKCGNLMINGRKEKGLNLKLGNETIERVNKYKYLGVIFDEKGTDGAKNNRIFKANQWWGRLCSIVKFRSNRYEIIRGIWKNIVVPSLLHGMDVVNWTMSEINKLESIQNKIGRLALGANKFVGVEAIRGDMGWSTFEERIMKGTLRYKIRIERMNDNRWARSVSMEAGNSSKWMMNCTNIANRSGIFRIWIRNQQGKQEWNLSLDRGDNNVYDEKKWKGIINTRVSEYGLEKWEKGMERKSTLRRYKKKKYPGKERFYDGNWISSLLFKARTDSLELNDRTYRFNDQRTKACEQGCTTEGRLMDETIRHIMTECEGYSEAMEWAMNEYKLILGINKFREITEQGEENGIAFLLGLEEDVPINVVETTKKYLGILWTERAIKILERQGVAPSPESE